MSSKKRLIEALKSSERDLLDRLGALLPAETAALLERAERSFLSWKFKQT